MKLGIIGSGYVGLVTGACFARLGHQVCCVDNDLRKIALLQKGKVPIYEPGLYEMVQENVAAGRLIFSSSIAFAVKNCAVLFICVNTPPKENGEADLSYVENVSRQIARHLREYRLIVEKSTVPVQTGEWIYKTIAESQQSKSLFDVASNPEFLREGSAIHDFLKPDRVIIGVTNKKSEEILRSLYKPLKAPLLVTDLKSAEIIKHASNSFLATKISFINAVARVCDAVGADVEKVAQGMGLDPRIGPSFLKAGIGFGGFCFPKDLAAFVRMAEKLNVTFGLLSEVLETNEQQKLYYVHKIKKIMPRLNGKTLAVLGLSFKPDTDDMRFAPSLDIIQALQREGAHIRAYDPQAIPKARTLLRKISYARNPYDAMRGADALLLLTEWSEFSNLDFAKVKRLLKHPLIFDGRNLYDPAEMRRLGIHYYGVGRNA